MAQRKYAGLLDIDDAPDIYESPEIGSQAQDTARSPSVSDGEENDTAGAGVSRSRLQIDQARDRFEGSRVDASAADFSDRVSAKKQSYIVSTRRRKKGGAKEENVTRHDHFESDEEEDDDEGLARRIARLNREIEEVKTVLRQREHQEGIQEGTKKSTEAEDTRSSSDDITALSKALASVHESQKQAMSAHARLARQLADPMPASELSATPAVYQPSPPDPVDEATLSKIASFDARLTSLESSLGLNAADISTSNSSVFPILPTMSLLDQQIALLSSPEDVPNLANKLQALQALQRGSSSQATNGIKEGGEEQTDDTDTVLTAEDKAALRSLYSLIPTLQDLGPTVPAILARLRSLRHLHADAAQAGQLLSDLERRQDETDRELKAWRSGIEGVEKAIQRAEAGFTTNVGEVEKWVRELEGKLQGLAHV